MFVSSKNKVTIIDAGLKSQIKAAYDLAEGAVGKSIPEDAFLAKGIDCAKLKKLRLLGSGTSNGVRVHWIKDRCAEIAKIPEPVLVAPPVPEPVLASKPKNKRKPRKRGK